MECAPLLIRLLLTRRVYTLWQARAAAQPPPCGREISRSRDRRPALRCRERNVRVRVSYFYLYLRYTCSTRARARRAVATILTKWRATRGWRAGEGEGGASLAASISSLAELS